MVSHQQDPKKRARLRWRSRRGLLENDLLITRFLDRHELDLSDEEVDVFCRLMELGDNELLELLLARSEPTGAMDSVQFHALLYKMRIA